jgi:hypothetical protein
MSDKTNQTPDQKPTTTATPWYKSVPIISLLASAIIGFVSTLSHVDLSEFKGDLSSGLIGAGILIAAIAGICKKIKAAPKQ